MLDLVLPAHRQQVSIRGKADLHFRLFSGRFAGLVVDLVVWYGELVYSLGFA